MVHLDPPHELLVCLAVERHGAQDWQQVATAVDPALVALGCQAFGDSLGAAQCEDLFKTHSHSVGTAGSALSRLVGELVTRRTAYLTATSAALKAQVATGSGAGDGGGDSGRARAGPSSGGRTRTAPAEVLGPDADGVDSWVDLAEEVRAAAPRPPLAPPWPPFSIFCAPASAQRSPPACPHPCLLPTRLPV
jgi:hypothetical protein